MILLGVSGRLPEAILWPVHSLYHPRYGLRLPGGCVYKQHCCLYLLAAGLLKIQTMLAAARLLSAEVYWSEPRIPSL